MTDITNITVDDVFTSDWLKADDLPTGGAIVKISNVKLEMTTDYNDPNKKNQTIILEFEDSDKQLAVNKTRSRSLVTITGSKRPIDWEGWEVVLQKATAPNGKPTVAIGPVAQPERGLSKAKAEEIEEAFE